MFSYDKLSSVCFLYSYRSANCMGRLIKRKNIKDEDAEYIKKGSHSHAPDARKKVAAVAMHSLKKAAKESKEKARNLVTEAVKCVDNVVAPTLPSVSQLARTVNRIRQKGNIIPNPRDLSEVKLDDILTEKGEKFLLYDNGSDDQRLLIFATKSNLEIMKNCDGIFADGTFKVAPHLFHQLYTVHGMSHFRREFHFKY